MLPTEELEGCADNQEPSSGGGARKLEDALAGQPVPGAGFLDHALLMPSVGSPATRERIKCCLTVFLENESCLVMSDSLPSHGLYRMLEWVAGPFSKGLFPTQGSSPGLLHCRQILYQLSHQGSLTSSDFWIKWYVQTTEVLLQHWGLLSEFHKL